MKTHSEVNFEKRGRVEDHQTCPVCQCCTCDGHTHSKLRTIFTFCLLTLALLLLPTLSLAADAPYDFKTVDIEITGRPDAVVWLRDINSKGWILASTFWTENGQPVWGSLIGKLNGRFNKLSQVEIFFDCTGTKLNDSRVIAGNSAAGPCVRRPNGSVLTLAGVPQAIALGISTDGRVTGNTCAPNGPPFFGCTTRAFTWKAEDGYTTFGLDPLAPIGAKVLGLNALGVTRFNQVLLDYYLSTPDNETFEHAFVIVDNGNIGQPFGFSFEWRGGSYFFTQDFNDDGQAIFQFTPNDGSGSQLQLYDEGFLAITGLPGSWLLSSLEGMSNERDFVGAYLVQTGFDSFYQSPIYTRHDFIATPILAQVAKK